MFALLADESGDNGGDEQLSIVVGVVVNADNDKDVIEEYFLGWIRWHEFDGHRLSNEIVNYLIRYGIEFEWCIAQCYDAYKSVLWPITAWSGITEFIDLF